MWVFPLQILLRYLAKNEASWLLYSFILLAQVSALGCSFSQITGQPDSSVDEVTDDLEAESECWDEDGDTYLDEVCGGQDCDDADAAVYPGALDICHDGVDQDCDGFDADVGLRGPPAVLHESVESFFSSFLWTGSEYSLFWHVMYDLEMRVFLNRFDARGTLLSGDTYVANHENAYYTVAWSGGQYGTAWVPGSVDDGFSIMYQTVSRLGEPLMEGNEISEPGNVVYAPIILPDESGFNVMWIDGLPAPYTANFSKVDHDGHDIIYNKVIVDFRTCSGRNLNAVLADDMIGLVWYCGADCQFHFKIVDSEGNTLSDDILVATGALGYDGAQVLWTGREFGLLWRQMSSTGDGHDVMFARFDASGTEIDRSCIFSTADSWSVFELSAIWTGTTYMLLWSEDLLGTGHYFYSQRMNAEGELLDPVIPISTSSCPGQIRQEWTGHELAVYWREKYLGDYSANMQRIGFCE
jgi:hypothetical protein